MNLDDLDYFSLTDMSNDEAIELLRQIRLSRRMPKKHKAKPKKKKKSLSVTPAQAAKILELLGGN